MLKHPIPKNGRPVPFKDVDDDNDNAPAGAGTSRSRSLSATVRSPAANVRTDAIEGLNGILEDISKKRGELADVGDYNDFKKAFRKSITLIEGKGITDEKGVKDVVRGLTEHPPVSYYPKIKDEITALLERLDSKPMAKTKTQMDAISGLLKIYREGPINHPQSIGYDKDFKGFEEAVMEAKKAIENNSSKESVTDALKKVGNSYPIVKSEIVDLICSLDSPAVSNNNAYRK